MQTLINTRIPDFRLQAYHNDNFKTVTQDDLRGKWSVFFFYPADFTFVCPTEIIAFADKLAEFVAEVEALGMRMLGPDVNQSDTDFTPVAKDNAIRFGLGAIKGVGELAAPKRAREIINQFGSRDKERIEAGHMLDVFPYETTRRFQNMRAST